MKQWMERISKWKFDKKIQLLVTVSIIVTTLIVLVVSTVSTVNSMKKQSIELLQAQTVLQQKISEILWIIIRSWQLPQYWILRFSSI